MKVRKLESTIRLAMISQQDAPPGDARKILDIAVKKIAVKLLNARLQLLRASDAQARAEKIRAAGIAAILKEFGGS